MTGKLIIRADGNAQIGAGHLARCMAVADAVVKLSGHRGLVQFFCADEESGEMARANGFEAAAFQTDYREMESELTVWKRFLEAVGGNAGDIVILVDSYYVTADYLRALRAYGKVYLMDDMQNHAYPVDAVINYNIFADAARYAQLYQGRETEFLLGGAYMPLREQFRNVAYQPARQVQNILITTGGGDADNIAGAVLDGIYRSGLTYHVLIGRFNPHLEDWRKRARLEKNIQIHSDVRDMAGLMKTCDLALTAGGSTVYELAAVGVPFICFSYAENQEALTEYIGRKNIAGYAGAWHLDRAGTTGRAARLFEKMCADWELRKKFSAAEKAMIDGKGAWRLAEKLLHES